MPPSNKLRNRCEVLLWLKGGRVRSIRRAAARKGMNKSQGSEWWEQYKAEGIEGFLCMRYKGPPAVFARFQPAGVPFSGDAKPF